MKLIIPEWSSEVLWGFAKLEEKVSQEIRCKQCDKWCKITVIPNRKLRELGRKK